jgi:hypothetical protein
MKRALRRNPAGVHRNQFGNVPGLDGGVERLTAQPSTATPELNCPPGAGRSPENSGVGLQVPLSVGAVLVEFVVDVVCAPFADDS